MLGFRPLCAGPLAANAVIGQTTIATVNYNLHPVNCIMSGDGEIKNGWRRILEFDVPPDRKTETVTASSGGVRRLSKTAPSFTTVTKRGGTH